MCSCQAIASGTLHAQWLQVGLTHIRKLLEGVAVPVLAEVPALNRPPKPSKRMFERPPSIVDATALLRDNLVQWSPVQQGKRAAFPGPAPTNARVAAVFTPKQVKARVSALFRPGGRIQADRRLPSQEASLGLARLAHYLIRNFERALAYHDAWFSVRVVLGHVYLAVPATRTLHVPANFDDVELSSFLDENLLPIIQNATERAMSDASVSRKAQKSKFDSR